MQTLDARGYQQFVREKPAAVVHFSAAWAPYHRAIARARMEEAAALFANAANFGEVDCDEEPALASSIPVLNVPCVAYYRNGVLVAALISMNQDVCGRLSRVLRDEPIGHGDGLSDTRADRKGNE